MFKWQFIRLKKKEMNCPNITEKHLRERHLSVFWDLQYIQGQGEGVALHYYLFIFLCFDLK